MVLAFPDPATWPDAHTPYEAEALAFCTAWLSGQDEFTLHTSGSTGTPKPIRLTRAQMKASARLTGQTLGLQPGDPALVCLNIRYVAGVMMLVRGLELKLPMTIIEPVSNPLAGFHAPADQFAFAALVPLQLQTILDTIDPDTGQPAQVDLLDSMKAILVGGAATSPALEEAIQAIRAPVYATYGMTESVSHIALRRLNGPERSDWFTALDGVTLGTDERGCLHITSAATNQQRIQTNDVVTLLPDNRFRLLGRADTIINTGGVKIQPEPVERLIQEELAKSGPVPRLFVAGIPDERLGQRVTLVSEPFPDWHLHWEPLQLAIRTAIGPYAVPKEWRIVANFAETPTGKLDRQATIARIV
ncbi:MULTISPECIES: AMP-binding protein [Spirosoma]|uniref:O-succinylbenzoic acid--CoA ligase n=1 Tax=Spirosoma sordidisoli TaxID=2502893 RepID=A0A4Q2UPA4_9BACT|nr:MULTISPECIES: AMP-binding protein [Spirosoma]RYC69435.1 O-succinylbenzoic acid--CoA ligase [Spirosoma sordidisoli]